MRFHSFAWLTVVAVAGCGPTGPSSLEGFGEIGDTDGVGDGVGDGDGDSGDGDSGDGDGDCIDASYGSVPEIYIEGELTPALANDFPGFCSETPAGDYALAWTAPFSGLFRAILYTDFVGSLSLLEGGCNGGLYDCSSGDNTIDFEAIEGQSYTFVIDGEFEGVFAFELYPFDVMPGGCPDGVVFAPDEPELGTTVGGSDDFASDCGGDGVPDRSFLFVPEQSGVYHIDTVGSTFDTVLHVIEGECEGPMLACNDDWLLDSLESGLDVALSAGVPYTIVVDGFGNAQGDFQLNVSFADEPLPPGVCADIIDLPPEPALVETWPVGETMADVWNQCVPMPSERRYRWQAPFAGSYQLTQVANGPAAISIVNGGCNGGSSTCEFTPGGDDNVVTFEAGAGQELVFISEWGPLVSSEVMLMLAPLDGCGQDLGSELPINVYGATVGGGDDYIGSCATNDAPDQEFRWTAPEAGAYKFTLEGSSYDTLMFILAGGCQGAELACNDDTMTNLGLELWSTIELELVAGQTVAVIVDGYNGSGEFKLSITQS